MTRPLWPVGANCAILAIRGRVGWIQSHCQRLTDSSASSSVLPIGRRRLAWLPVLVKRYIDISINALLLLLTFPSMGLIAVLIKLDSRGHVLFRRQRLGLNRQRLDIVKFRSMRNEACADPIVIQARRGDPRVTRIGWFLRRTSLDDLPQPFNVLKGEMSLVGPPSHAASHDERLPR
jgi:lipopolysaccharide/colanic/teichoic acid biosynthesis glycosyltransferase